MRGIHIVCSFCVLYVLTAILLVRAAPEGRYMTSEEARRVLRDAAVLHGAEVHEFNGTHTVLCVGPTGTGRKSHPTLLVFSQHGDELLAHEMVAHLAERYAHAVADREPGLLEAAGVRVCFLPTASPTALDAGTRAVDGVDPNRAFPLPADLVAAAKAAGAAPAAYSYDVPRDNRVVMHILTALRVTNMLVLHAGATNILCYPRDAAPVWDSRRHARAPSRPLDAAAARQLAEAYAATLPGAAIRNCAEWYQARGGVCDYAGELGIASCVYVELGPRKPAHTLFSTHYAPRHWISFTNALRTLRHAAQIVATDAHGSPIDATLSVLHIGEGEDAGPSAVAALFDAQLNTRDAAAVVAHDGYMYKMLPSLDDGAYHVHVSAPGYIGKRVIVSRGDRVGAMRLMLERVSPA